jgi:hypothetical protein
MFQEDRRNYEEHGGEDKHEQYELRELCEQEDQACLERYEEPMRRNFHFHREANPIDTEMNQQKHGEEDMQFQRGCNVLPTPDIPIDNHPYKQPQ